jgi:O-antigen/teichoic acid export membrane protein
MKFCTYNSTPGLDRYLLGQRYQVWRDAHKELMSTDLEYRQANRRFKFQTIASSIFFIILMLAFSFSIGRVADNAWLLGFVIVAFVTVVLAYVFFTLRMSFRMQHFMNEAVGRVLRSR